MLSAIMLDSGRGGRDARPAIWPDRQHHLGNGQVAALADGPLNGGQGPALRRFPRRFR